MHNNIKPTEYLVILFLEYSSEGILDLLSLGQDSDEIDDTRFLAFHYSSDEIS